MGYWQEHLFTLNRNLNWPQRGESWTVRPSFSPQNFLFCSFVNGLVNDMADNLDEWFRRLVSLGEADIPMDIGGQIMTPREYMRMMGRNV